MSKHAKMGMFTNMDFPRELYDMRSTQVHNFNGAVNHQLNHFVHGGINRLNSYGKWMNMARLQMIYCDFPNRKGNLPQLRLNYQRVYREGPTWQTKSLSRFVDLKEQQDRGLYGNINQELISPWSTKVPYMCKGTHYIILSLFSEPPHINQLRGLLIWNSHDTSNKHRWQNTSKSAESGR